MQKRIAIICAYGIDRGCFQKSAIRSSMLLKRSVSRVVHEQNRPTCRQEETRWWAQDRKTRTRTVVLIIIITSRPFAALIWDPITLAQVVPATRPSAMVVNYLSEAIPASRRIPRIKVSSDLFAKDIIITMMRQNNLCGFLKRNIYWKLFFFDVKILVL